MKKAVVLSDVSVTQDEFLELRDTDVYKLALNHHASEYKPNARIFSDYFDLAKLHLRFPNDIIYTVRCKPLRPVKNIVVADVEFKGSTMIAAIEFLIQQGAEKILLVADNTVHSQHFRDEIYNNILKLPTNTRIYQFRTGYFPLPVLGVRDFLWNI